MTNRAFPHLLVALAALASPAQAAQPDNPPPQSPPAEQPVEARSPRERFADRTDPEAVKQRLRRRLEESQRQTEQLQRALDRLERGESPADVLPDVLPFQRGFRQDRWTGGPDLAPEDRPEGAPLPREGGPRFSPEDRRRMLGVLREELPAVHARLEEIRAIDPEIADRMLDRIAPRFHAAMEVRRRDSELFRLRLDELRAGLQVLDAVREYRVSQRLPEDHADTASKREEAWNNLRESLSAHFDQRLAVQAREAESLSKRVEDIRADLEHRQATKPALIDRMLAVLKDGKTPRDLLGPPGGKMNPPERGQPREQDRDPDDQPPR